MGCGASSLKGEEVNVNGAMPAPRRVNTNFASVDYSQEANQGRRMTEYAPHETASASAKKSHDTSGPAVSGRPSEATDGRAGISHLNGDGALASNVLRTNSGVPAYPHQGSKGAGVTGGRTDQETLKPYVTNSGDGWDNEDNATARNLQQSSQVNGTQDSDPTSLGAKTHFAHQNDPASIENQESRKEKEHKSQSLDPSSADATSEGDDGRKKSWLGDKYSKYHAAKHGKNVVLSDEELKKYTGKDRKELNEWAEGKRVGANQPASRVNGDNALAADQYSGS